jgi:hypothetical protein
MNEDGLAGKQPFDRDGGGWARHQRFMLIERESEPDPPSDDELAQMKITRERSDELISRLNREHDAALTLAGASYDVVLARTKTTHMDFTDLPLLASRTNEDADVRERVVATVRSLALAFFEWSLQGKRPSLLRDKPAKTPIESIRQFGAVP